MGRVAMLDWAVGTGIAVSLLIIFVLIVRRPFARLFGARAAYALWLLPFMRLIMPEVTIPRIFPQLTETATPKVAAPMEVALTPEIFMAADTPPSLMVQIAPYVQPMIFAIWAIGAILFFFYHWARQASLMDRLTYASEPATGLQPAISLAARTTGLKHIPQVRISDDKAGPLVAGFFRPIIILPHNFMTAFNANQRHYALMHEFMHIKRRDIWVALAWLGFRAVNWPNPLVHFAAKHFRSDQEAACDASVLSAMGDSQSAVAGYAETLIHAAKTAIIDGRASPAPSQLALTIHHPLKERLMILGTHRKTSNWRTRMAASAMIIGAATLSAPLTVADFHPETELSEEELAGKAESHTGKSVIKRKYTRDGKSISEHFEINIDGEEIKAYAIDERGNKTRIDVETIEGVDIADLKSGRRTISISNGDDVKFMSRDEFKKWAEKEYPEWKDGDYASWLEGDIPAWISKNREGKIVFKNKDGSTRFSFNDVPKPPNAPFPPGFSKHSDGVVIFDSEDFDGFEIKGLETLKALKNLENLEDMDGFETFSFFSDEGGQLKLKMRLTESKLAAARAMLENTELEPGDSREMAKAKRELEKARKALKAAEKALREAE